MNVKVKVFRRLRYLDGSQWVANWLKAVLWYTLIPIVLHLLLFGEPSQDLINVFFLLGVSRFLWALITPPFFEEYHEDKELSK